MDKEKQTLIRQRRKSAQKTFDAGNKTREKSTADETLLIEPPTFLDGIEFLFCLRCKRPLSLNG